MSKIRLAWLSTHPIQYQASLLRAIAQSPGIDLTVLFFSDFSTRNYLDREFGREIKWDIPLLEGYQYEFLAGTGHVENRVNFTRPRIKGLAERLTKKNFDAVMIQGWNHYGYVAAAWYAKRSGLKVLLRCEATDHVASSTGLKRLVREEVVKFILSRTDCCLSIGSRNRDFYRCRGVSENRIGFMPYCVDNEYFRRRAENADTTALAKSMGLEPDIPVILYASKLNARKHADQLLAAYSQLDGRRPYLLFVGDGELLPTLKNMAEKDNLDNVRFLGFLNQSELPAFYALADIFVLPSINETWGLVVNEAMNAGCAIVVTTEVGSGADLVESGENGYVVPADDVPALTKALTSCLQNSHYKKMGQQSQRIISRWGIESNVAGLRTALGLTEGSL